MKFCSQCGARMADSALFCGACGAKLLAGGESYHEKAVVGGASNAASDSVSAEEKAERARLKARSKLYARKFRNSIAAKNGKPVDRKFKLNANSAPMRRELDNYVLLAKPKVEKLLQAAYACDAEAKELVRIGHFDVACVDYRKALEYTQRAWCEAAFLNDVVPRDERGYDVFSLEEKAQLLFELGYMDRMDCSAVESIRANGNQAAHVDVDSSQDYRALAQQSAEALKSLLDSASGFWRALSSENDSMLWELVLTARKRLFIGPYSNGPARVQGEMREAPTELTIKAQLLSFLDGEYFQYCREPLPGEPIEARTRPKGLRR